MLEYEIAAIYYFIADTISATPYFEEVPEDLLIPCVFYPTPEQTGGTFSLSKYSTDFVMYIKFMAQDTFSAYSMANTVMQKLMKGKRKIPIIDLSGAKTGKSFQVNNPIVRKVDNGVYQMEVSWKRYTPYDENKAALAKEVFINFQKKEIEEEL